MIHAHGVVCGYDTIPLSEAEKGHLENVSQRIRVAINKIRAAADDNSAPVFVKLNHRSPKDVAIEPKNTKTRFCLRKLLENIDENDKLSQVRPEYFLAISRVNVANLTFSRRQ
jgi:hypothetical protein